MDTITKALLAGVIWYFAHKFIRVGLNKNVKWDDKRELDARLGGLAAAAATVLKVLI